MALIGASTSKLTSEDIPLSCPTALENCCAAAGGRSSSHIQGHGDPGAGEPGPLDLCSPRGDRRRYTCRWLPAAWPMAGTHHVHVHVESPHPSPTSPLSCLSLLFLSTFCFLSFKKHAIRRAMCGCAHVDPISSHAHRKNPFLLRVAGPTAPRP
jgi:hypothetical protein